MVCKEHYYIIVHQWPWPGELHIFEDNLDSRMDISEIILERKILFFFQENENQTRHLSAGVTNHICWRAKSFLDKHHGGQTLKEN